jgi:hypothetical protein
MGDFQEFVLRELGVEMKSFRLTGVGCVAISHCAVLMKNLHNFFCMLLLTACCVMFYATSLVIFLFFCSLLN